MEQVSSEPSRLGCHHQDLRRPRAPYCHTALLMKGMPYLFFLHVDVFKEEQLSLTSFFFQLWWILLAYGHTKSPPGPSSAVIKEPNHHLL